MNLVPFETPPLRRQDRVHATTTKTTPIRSKDASSRSAFFDGHLDLSLSMSMSHDGGSGCNATGCSSEAKARDGHGGCNRSSDEAGCLSSGVTTVTPGNALSAGHGHVGDLKAGAGWTSTFMPSPTGFMHPWSLAARQQKAAAEQDRRTPAAGYVPSEARAIPLPSAIGWPPVHTSRRNLITAMHTTKSDSTGIDDGPKGVTMPAGNEKTSTDVTETRPPLANMFAKVHMEGYAIARKINLRAHGSYDSLSRVLTKMTRNFFSPADCSSVNAGKEEFCTGDKFIFLYEDFEGDRMLVADVPWELFLASVKRLYIVRNPVPGDKGHPGCDKNDTTEKATNN